jgi:heterodisulfide reductase subunit C
VAEITRSFAVSSSPAPNRTAPLWALVRRAKSTCDACGLCTVACGKLQPHRVLRAVAHGSSVAGASEARACDSCGACDRVCPLALRPGAIVAEVARRLEGAA